MKDQNQEIQEARVARVPGVGQGDLPRNNRNEVNSGLA